VPPAPIQSPASLVSVISGRPVATLGVAADAAAKGAATGGVVVTGGASLALPDPPPLPPQPENIALKVTIEAIHQQVLNIDFKARPPRHHHLCDR
jgi:hypothetical protein